MKSKAQSILKNFIVLEGLDGAGTTTQLALCERLLNEKGVPVLATCEPTAGPVGVLIREVLRKKTSVRPETLAFLFAADRQEHLEARPGGIQEALVAGRLVLCDRYLFSSLAYQSVEADDELVRALNARFPLPEILIYLDTPPAVCAERRKARGKPELFEEAAFQDRVERAYRRVLSLHRRSGMRLEVIDGTLSAEKIRDRIWTILSSLPIVRG